MKFEKKIFFRFITILLLSLINSHYSLAESDQPTILDNLSDSCTTFGEWTSSIQSPYFYDVDYEYSHKGNGKSKFAWEFSVEEEGFYKIMVHWCPARNRATNSKYYLKSFLGIEIFNRDQTKWCGYPDDISDWDFLGIFPFLSKTQNKIILNNDSNGYVIADAISYEKVNDLNTFLIDNRDSRCQIIGDWGISTQKQEYFGEDYYHKYPGTGLSKFIWNFTIESDGIYEIFAWWPVGMHVADNAKYIVKYADGAAIEIMNQAYTGGRWNLLGEYFFMPGEYSITLNNDANDFVLADAILIREKQNENRLIIDDASPYSTFTGPWQSSDCVRGFYGEGYRYLQYSPSYRFTWNPKVTNDGLYEVYARWTSALNRCEHAVYEVGHSAGKNKVAVNQKSMGGEWVSLGTFPFLKDKSFQISLYGESEGFIIADAIKLEFRNALYGEWYIKKITNTEDVRELCPVIDNGNLSWLGKQRKVIQYYNGEYIQTIFDVPDNSTIRLGAPNISNGQVVWRGYDGNGKQIIYFWNGEQTVIVDMYLTEGEPYIVEPDWGYPPSIHCLNPTINNGRIAYPKWDGEDYEIFLWEEGKIFQITDNSVDDLEPSINGNNIAFVRWDRYVSQSQDILLWTGEKFLKVSATSTDDQDPDTDGQRVTYCRWNNLPGKKFDIYVWEDGEIKNVSNKDGSDYEPQIDGDLVVWHGQNSPGDKFDIYVWDGSKITVLADSEYNQIHPWVSGNQVCWTSSDGKQYDIYLATKIK